MVDNDGSKLDAFIKVMEQIAEGDYDADIMSYTTEDNPPQLRRVAEAMGMMLVKVEAREFQLMQLVEELRELNSSIKRGITQAVSAMCEALGARDPYTMGHARRVAGYAKMLARHIGLDAKEIDHIWWAGMLHDVGKIGFSDALFQNEDTQPTPQMLDEIKQHPDISAHIVEQLEFLGNAREYVWSHHERLDGKGYPRQLSGDDIPHGARIVAVADVYDAITTDRPYQKGRTREQAFAILRSLSGTSLDVDLVEAFITALPEDF